MKRWLALLLLGLSLVVVVWMRVHKGPFYYGSGDPDYFYLMGGYNLLQGLPLYAIDHPGIPLYLVSALWLKLTGVVPTDLYVQIESHMWVLWLTGLGIWAGSALWVALRLPRESDQCQAKALGYLVLLFPVLSGFAMVFAENFTPNLVFLCASPWLCYLLYRDGRGRTFWLGLLLGVLVMTKLPAMFLVVWVVLVRRDRLYLMLGWSVGMLMFLPWLMPQALMFVQAIGSWVTSPHGYATFDRGILISNVAHHMVSSPWPVVLPMLLVLGWRRSLWPVALYAALLLAVMVRWGIPRYTTLLYPVIPYVIWCVWCQLGDKMLRVGFILLCSVCVLPYMIERGTKVWADNYSIKGYHIEGYGAPTPEYALFYGWISTGRWLPRPPLRSDVIYLHSSWDGIPASPKLRFPAYALYAGKVEKLTSRDSLSSVVSPISYLTNMPPYKNWFRDRVIEYNTIYGQQLVVPALTPEQALDLGSARK